MENTGENREKIGKIQTKYVKRYEKYGRKTSRIVKGKLNSPKIWKKIKLNSEKILKIQKKSKSSSEEIVKIWKKGNYNSDKIWTI